MKSDLKTSIIQSELIWKDINSNLSMFDKKINSISKKTDLIILPEMFTTGFTMEIDFVNEKDEELIISKMQDWALTKNAAICGSIIVKENNNSYNRLYFIKPDGSYQTYNKRHLFRMADEDKYFTAGNEKIIIDYKGWKIRPLICYDLRFPVWSRNINNEYDLLIFVANWPTPRKNAWSTLLKARAMENLAYCIGVNRIGSDNNGMLYSGSSAIIDFKGDTIFENEDGDVIKTETLSKDNLDAFREKFPAQSDADNFDII